MSGISIFKPLFPIDSVEKICNLFEQQLTSDQDPDLAFFSIVVGAIENNLTAGGSTPVVFPRLEWETVSSLHSRFSSLICSSVDQRLIESQYATRELVKRVSDIIWNSLTRSYYKDRAHLQSIYSFLTGKKLDCFGVAFAVTAGCQVLGFKDVHLALSEDHAWLVFGKDGLDTAEVTWHGKGMAARRGCPVEADIGSWLYAAGRPVICSRRTELAALVSSINPALTPTTDVVEVALIQRQLLWALYDKGYLDAYPMALGNLADLEEELREEDSKTDKPDCIALYSQGIRVARALYSNRHVYPYTVQGGYYHRQKMYKEAFHAWADAGDVIRQYNYSRDDEEIYKEFAEIANELIPQLMKVESSGHSARSILKDPECFASLLRFYDGICAWEEGSATPILHIGWARPLLSTISKFEAEVRAQVRIVSAQEPVPAEAAAPERNNNGTHQPELSVHEQVSMAINSRPEVRLFSQKMLGLRELLLAEKLNTHAISLQLTAQSQLRPRHPASLDHEPRAKRRREH